MAYEPLRVDWSATDDDFFKRRSGRRYRFRDDALYTGKTRHDYWLMYGTSNARLRASGSNGTPFGGVQRTLDFNNASKLRCKTRDTGSPFLSEKIYVSPPTEINWELAAGGYRLFAETSVHPGSNFSKWFNLIRNNTISFDGIAPVPDVDLITLGASAIAQTIPTKPEMSLSTSIAELKDGIPSLIGASIKKDKRLSSLGAEHLNYQFGVLPLVDDARDVVRLTRDYEKILKQFRRDQGRVVRRKRTLDEYSTSSSFRDDSLETVYAGGGKNPIVNNGYMNGTNVDRVTTAKIWFSAAYAIAYSPHLDGLIKDISEFNRVYGVIPNAETLWNILPYSWLADWFGNVGDVITNVTYLSSPAVKLNYAYVMCEQEYRYTVSGVAYPNQHYLRNSARENISSSLVWNRKRRIRASPLGFGVRFDGLSDYQRGILTALGLSRLKL